MLRKLIDGILAGIMISLGGSVYLACDNKYIGAVLFSVALLCICLKSYSLYTGKIGYIALSHKKDDVSSLFLGLLGNLIGSVLAGYLILLAFPKLHETAKVICESKLTQDIPTALIRGVFCGILMYLAVSIYREKNNIVGILFCIPVFILSGFEHSIADMFYFAVSGIVSLKALLFIMMIVLGNSIGSILIALLTKREVKNER